MGDYNEKTYFYLEDFKNGWLEELEFILGVLENVTEDEREAVKNYMTRYMAGLKEEAPVEGYRLEKRSGIEDYEEEIERTKEDIKYLKKLKKRKEELEDKNKKRYEILRKLYKERLLEPDQEEEYRLLRSEMKHRRNR